MSLEDANWLAKKKRALRFNGHRSWGYVGHDLNSNRPNTPGSRAGDWAGTNHQWPLDRVQITSEYKNPRMNGPRMMITVDAITSTVGSSIFTPASPAIVSPRCERFNLSTSA
jgi:hypothetical protein